MSGRAFLVLVALLAAAHAATFVGYGPCDDDFIAYRYARNLVEGHGLVFNEGERVEGFSAPGWTLLVALAIKLGTAAPAFSVVVSIAASAVAAFAIGSVWHRRHPDDRFHVPALLAAASPAIAWHAIQGLGTLLQTALLALWLELWDRALQRNTSTLAAAIVLGLAALVRNESIVFVLVFVAFEARSGRWRTAWPALAPIGVWQIVRVNYYGDWTPITYAVKKLPFLVDLRFGAKYLIDSTASTGVGLALVLALVVAVRRREATDAALRAAAIGCAAYTAVVVYVGGDFMDLARFFVPILPLALLLACETVSDLVGAQRAIGVALACVALAVEQIPQRERGWLKERHGFSEARWIAVGRELPKHVPPATKLALAPIGAIGYESRLYIVDMLGLTNTAIANAEPNLGVPLKGHQRHDSNWVLAQEPQMILIGTGHLEVDPRDGKPMLGASDWEGDLVAHPRFRAEYEPLEIDVAGSQPLVFFWRRGVERPSGARTP